MKPGAVILRAESNKVAEWGNGLESKVSQVHRLTENSATAGNDGPPTPDGGTGARHPIPWHRGRACEPRVRDHEGT